jgi:hypothetical protein
MNATADEIINTFHVHIPSERRNALHGEHFPDELYFLMQPRVPVAIYTQQCRALNLIWALAHRSEKTRRIKGKDVIVVGAGAAGLAAAIGAVLAGAKKVTVLEKADTPMSLQLGCEHRFLHPRFHTWPKESSHSAAAALPFLTWHVGTAGDVAERLRAEFCMLSQKMSNLDPKFNVSDIKFRKREGSTGCHVHYAEGAQRQAQGPIDCDMLILAVGFGVEKTVDGLSPRSYWRVDSLSQRSLGSPGKKFQVLVAGDGDGGVIDALRACLKDFDHGPFIDRIVEIASDFHEALNKIEEAEKTATNWRQVSKRRDLLPKIDAANELYNTYHDLAQTDAGRPFVDRLSRYLNKQLRDEVDVTYLGELEHTTSPESYTLNRVLGWLVERMPGRGFTWRQGSLRCVRPVQLERTPGLWRGYSATVRPIKGFEENWDENFWKNAVWNDVVLRYGAIRPLENEFGAWGKIVYEIWEKKGEVQAPIRGNTSEGVTIDPGILQPDADEYFWPLIDPYRDDVTKDVNTGCRLRACVLPDPNKKRETRASAKSERLWELHTIKIWVESPPPGTRWVKYNLHPYRNGIQRWATSGSDKNHKFSLRIFTHDDYWVSAELSGGGTISGWLTQILEKGFDGKKKALKAMRIQLSNGRHDPSPEHFVPSDAPLVPAPSDST